MACPMSGRFDINEKSTKTETDPRAMIALARVNWLHSHYSIVRYLPLITKCMDTSESLTVQRRLSVHVEPFHSRTYSA